MDVEDRDDPEAVVGKDVGGGDRLSEMPGPEQRDVVLARGPEDLADLGDQRVDVVADAPLAELAEAERSRRIWVELTWVQEPVLRGDRLRPIFRAWIRTCR